MQNRPTTGQSLPPDIHSLCCEAIRWIKGFNNESEHFAWALENDGRAFILVDDSRGNAATSGFFNSNIHRGQTVDAADLLSFKCDPHFTRCVGIKLRKGETY